VYYKTGIFNCFQYIRFLLLIWYSPDFLIFFFIKPFVIRIACNIFNDYNINKNVNIITIERFDFRPRNWSLPLIVKFLHCYTGGKWIKRIKLQELQIFWNVLQIFDLFYFLLLKRVTSVLLNFQGFLTSSVLIYLIDEG